MKVLQLGKFYPIRGGVEKVMYEFTKGLGERGVACDMLCADYETKSDRVVELGPDSRIVCKKAIAKVAATTLSPGMVFWLRKHCNEYSIIHVHHPDPMAAAALWFSGYKGKVVLHWHSDILKQKFLLVFFSPLQTWLLKRADKIVGTSPVYVRESKFLADFQDKVTYLPIGIDEMRPSPDEVQKIKDSFKGEKLIFSIGRLVEYKGYEYLIDAVRHLPDGYRLAIGGQGPLRDSLESRCRELCLQDRVSFLGWVSDEDLPAWFGACDVFALSSIHKTEAFAIVQIEAMSCSRPVISTRIQGSGVPWVNADGVSGITVPTMDPKAIADAVLEICRDSERHDEFCRKARRRYEQLFTKENMISSLLSLYSGIIPGVRLEVSD
ncbi:MAG: glycosyltransferase [Bacteroidales bacterium]|nr:glycosyltransferase [Bacteroidales bacterium]